MKISLDTISFPEQLSFEDQILAENSGFHRLWFGDHFLPWHHSYKQNYFVWSSLPAIAAKTREIKLGVDVTVPIGGRYHPAIIAQASSTIDQIFPGRFSLGVGSGEAMSESRFMTTWPPWRERMDRLVEAIDLIRKLWTSEDYFDFYGKYFTMEKVFLYVKPKSNIPIYFSAIGEKSAMIAGKTSDLLMTVGTVERCRDVIFPKFLKGSQKVGRDRSKLERVVQMDGGIGDTKTIVAKIRKMMAGASVKEMNDERDPRIIERVAHDLPDEHILNTNYVCENSDQLTEIFRKYAEIGVNEIIWGDNSPDFQESMKTFRTKIIPQLKNL